MTVACLFLFKDSDRQKKLDKTCIILLLLLFYIVISLPLVQWPGSVMRFGFENYFKVIIFYFFTVLIIVDQRKLRIMLIVFMACQIFRVLEPLYLHWTTGYWGDNTHLGDGIMMDRLAGAPHDPINPNGLAYAAVTAISFLYYFCQTLPTIFKMAGYLLLPIISYAVVLTSSRSGMLALGGVAVAIIMTSRKKIMLLGLVLVIAIFAFQHLGQEQKERYISIYRNDVRGAETAQGRIDGLVSDFRVAMNNPMFGHGLGTSLEANYNVARSVFRSHNLIIEVWQEIGLIGLLIFSCFIIASIRNYLLALSSIKQSNNALLFSMTKGVGAWLTLNVIFCIFSYGLSTYAWYLFGGLSVVLLRLSENHNAIDTNRVA